MKNTRPFCRLMRIGAQYVDNYIHDYCSFSRLRKSFFFLSYSFSFEASGPPMPVYISGLWTSEANQMSNRIKIILIYRLRL
jgi:hypothetical protein